VGAVDLEVLVGLAVGVTDLRVLLGHRGLPATGESTDQQQFNLGGHVVGSWCWVARAAASRSYIISAHIILVARSALSHWTYQCRQARSTIASSTTAGR